MTAGAFNDAARAAIVEAGNGRCLGCGRPDVTTQHRRARGMGGTSDVTIGHPANGVPLCGDGVRGCHGWAEHHPADAELLGWRLAPGLPALGAPFWSRFGWRAWAEELEVATDTGRTYRLPLPYVGTVYVDEEDLDRPLERGDAILSYKRARPVPRDTGKPTR